MTTETSPGSSANSHWRNNLMLGQGAGPAIFSVTTNTAYNSSDFNGFRSNPGAPYAFLWNVVPPAAPGADPVGRGAAGGHGGAAAGGDGALQPYQYRTLADFQRATGQDCNSVLVDFDVFVKVPKLDRDPKTVQRLHDLKDLDFRLRSGSRRSIAAPCCRTSTTGSPETPPILARSSSVSQCRSTDHARDETCGRPTSASAKSV